MTTTRALPVRRGPAPASARPHEDAGRSAHDPAGLGAALREFAMRAHRAVRAVDAVSRAGGDPARQAAGAVAELARLLPRIVQLQHRVGAAPGSRLASYLAALRREVERRLD